MNEPSEAAKRAARRIYDDYIGPDCGELAVPEVARIIDEETDCRELLRSAKVLIEVNGLDVLVGGGLLHSQIVEALSKP